MRKLGFWIKRNIFKRRIEASVKTIDITSTACKDEFTYIVEQKDPAVLYKLLNKFSSKDQQTLLNLLDDVQLKETMLAQGYYENKDSKKSTENKENLLMIAINEENSQLATNILDRIKKLDSKIYSEIILVSSKPFVDTSRSMSAAHSQDPKCNVLHRAIINGDINLIEKMLEPLSADQFAELMLVQAKILPNGEKARFFKSPLILALECNNIDLVKKLLSFIKQKNVSPENRSKIISDRFTANEYSRGRYKQMLSRKFLTMVVKNETIKVDVVQSLLSDIKDTLGVESYCKIFLEEDDRKRTIFTHLKNKPEIIDAILAALDPSLKTSLNKDKDPTVILKEYMENQKQKA